MERVQLNGADIEYDVRGSGAPVVFIHGAILSDGFVPVIEQTGIAENFQIVHYRRRGYAGSSRAPAGVYGQDYRRFTDGALPAGAFDRAVSDIDTFFRVELGAMQRWNITTEGLKDIRHPVLSMRGSDTLPVFFEVADLLQQWIPEIDTVSIPCASHDLPGRNPVAVASGLVEFFTKNGARYDPSQHASYFRVANHRG
jgi:pimeloyl-ACP methyl ester carboxylesterase